MSFLEGAKGAGEATGKPESSRNPAPEGRNEVARALYLSMLHEAFVLSAGSTGAMTLDPSVGSAVRASVPVAGVVSTVPSGRRS